MKRIFILFVLSAIALAACRRDPSIPFVSYLIEDEQIEVYSESCVITCRIESIDGDMTKIRVLVDKDKDFSSAIHYDMQASDGQWRCDVTGLLHNTRYYYCYEIYTNVETYRFKEVNTFTTLVVTGITVSTSEITNITQTTAQGGGSVTTDSVAIIERGICWNTSQNPTISNNHAYNGTGEGSYTVNMTGLNANTTYYVRAYATNSLGTTYGNEVSFTTLKVANLPTVITKQVTNIQQTSATGGGEVTADGDSEVTERGICWNTSPNPTILNSHANNGTGIGDYTVNMSGLTINTTYYVRAYATNSAGTAYGGEVSFTTHYTIAVSANPSNGGTIVGGGAYQDGQTCTVSATANTGYAFVNWTENDNIISTDANYTFTVTGNRSLVANFIVNPQGTINGLFTINSNGDRVFFSQGNLQYIGSAATPYWKFSDHQWDCLGNNGQGSTNPYVDRDLFSWGTSGYNHGAVCYQPYSTSQSNTDYYVYGQSTNNLYDQTGKADWGYNKISNGGNTTNMWRTLTGGTNGEWCYVFNTRNASSLNGVANARYAKAKVAGVQGIILFPDNYSHPASVALPVGINEMDITGWNWNDYSANDFVLMQSAGAVFLPAAGGRDGTSVLGVGIAGDYWSASCSNSNDVYFLNFLSDRVIPYVQHDRYPGYSVRLVQDLR